MNRLLIIEGDTVFGSRAKMNSPDILVIEEMGHIKSPVGEGGCLGSPLSKETYVILLTISLALSPSRTVSLWKKQTDNVEI